MTAGPTPVPPAVSQAMATPMLYHRAPAFVELYERVLRKLPARLPHEQRRADVRRQRHRRAWSRPPRTSSARARRRSPAPPASSASAGSSSARPTAASSCATSRAGARGSTPAEIERLLGENDGIEVVFATLSETSTGIVHDVQAIAEVVNRHGAILAVDAVSGLGAAELRQDEWGIDVVVAGSQKALMCPPGLGFASVSQRALDYVAARPGGRYYFDWTRTRQQPAQGRQPVHAGRRPLPGARRRARHDRGGGPRQRHGAPPAARARHARRRRRRSASTCSAIPTSARRSSPRSSCPTTIDGGKVPGALRKLGITANGGQNQLKGRILRIAHCGYFGAFDILTSLAGLEMVAAAARPRGRARRRRRRRAARVPRGGRARRARPREPTCSTSPTASSSRRRSPTRASTSCASSSTSTSASTGPTRSSPSASATTTGS